MKNILLVEDELWLGELYQKLFVKAGFDVRWCRDGYDAIDLIDQKQPDLIVLDILLPWANGIQLLHELASNYDLASIPVIICSSALPKEITLENLRHYGVVKILDKTSIKPRQLLAAVKETTNADV